MTDQRERFFEELCSRRTHFVIVFAFAVLFLILQVPYLLVVDFGSTLAVVSVLNVVGASMFAAFSGGVLWFCKRRSYDSEDSMRA